jgi:hypothetical protein
MFKFDNYLPWVAQQVRQLKQNWPNSSQYATYFVQRSSLEGHVTKINKWEWPTNRKTDLKYRESTIKGVIFELKHILRSWYLQIVCNLVQSCLFC